MLHFPFSCQFGEKGDILVSFYPSDTLGQGHSAAIRSITHTPNRTHFAFLPKELFFMLCSLGLEILAQLKRKMQLIIKSSQRASGTSSNFAIVPFDPMKGLWELKHVAIPISFY